jgi:hypothetical protein
VEDVTVTAPLDLTPALQRARLAGTSPKPAAPSPVSDPPAEEAQVSTPDQAPKQQQATRRGPKGETDEQAKARVEREKAEYAANEKSRQAVEASYSEKLAQEGRLAAQIGLPGLAQWQKEQSVARTDQDREAEKAEYETRMASTAQQLSQAISEASHENGSWDARRSVLGKAKVSVAAHLADLSSLKSSYYDKLAGIAGDTQERLVQDVQQKMSEVDQRKQFLESYYSVLERLAGNDEAAATDLKQLGATHAEIDPEMVRSSSKMRLAARRRSQTWQELG